MRLLSQGLNAVYTILLGEENGTFSSSKPTVDGCLPVREGGSARLLKALSY